MTNIKKIDLHIKQALEPLKLYTCTNFLGMYPVGTSAIVLAKSKQAAVSLLEDSLSKIGLRQSISLQQLIEITLDSPKAIILNSGDY